MNDLQEASSSLYTRSSENAHDNLNISRMNAGISNSNHDSKDVVQIEGISSRNMNDGNSKHVLSSKVKSDRSLHTNNSDMIAADHKPSTTCSSIKIESPNEDVVSKPVSDSIEVTNATICPSKTITGGSVSIDSNRATRDYSSYLAGTDDTLTYDSTGHLRNKKVKTRSSCNSKANTRANRIVASYSNHNNRSYEALYNNSKSKDDLLQIALASTRSNVTIKENDLKDIGVMTAGWKLKKYFNACWQKQILCDFIMSTESSDIVCHKMAIGCQSPLLTDMFHNINTDTGLPLMIDLKQYPHKIVADIVRFAYSSEFIVTDSNLDATLACANDIDFEMIINMCLVHLKKYCVSNAILYYSISARHNITFLVKLIYNYILENFLDIYQLSTFSHLSFERLQALLSDDGLNVHSESDILLAMFVWLNHDLSRYNKAEELTNCVRMKLQNPVAMLNEIEPQRYSQNPELFHQLLFLLNGDSCTDSRHGTDVQQLREDKYGQATPPLAWKLKEHQRNVIVREYGGSANVKLHSSPQAYRSMRQSPAQALFKGLDQKIYSQPPNERTNGTPTQRQSPLIFKNGYETPQYIHAETIQRSPEETQVDPLDFPDYAMPDNDSLTFKKGYETLQYVNAETIPRSPEQALVGPLYFPGYVKPDNDQVSFNTNSSIRLNQGDPTFDMLRVFVVGGIDMQSGNDARAGKCIQMYNPVTNYWKEFDTLPHSRHHHCIVTLNGLLYVLGGYASHGNATTSSGVASRSVLVFDPRNRKWKEVAGMLKPRTYHSAATDGRYIYVVGGEDEERRKLDTVELYDPVADKWMYFAQLETGPKIGTCVSVFHNQLYVIGGYNMARMPQPILNDVECFDLQDRRWLKKAKLASPVCHASVVIINNNMYLIGGKTKILVDSRFTLTSRSSIAMYNEAADAWSYISKMTTARHDTGCAVIGSKVFIVGGRNTSKPSCIAEVECFDTSTGTWLKGLANMLHPATASGCCSISM